MTDTSKTPRTLTKAEELVFFALYSLQADGVIDRTQMCDALGAAREELSAAYEKLSIARQALQDVILRVDDLETQEHKPISYIEVRALADCAMQALRKLGE